MPYASGWEEAAVRTPWANIGSVSVQRRRRWTKTEPMLGYGVPVSSIGMAMMDAED